MSLLFVSLAVALIGCANPSPTPSPSASRTPMPTVTSKPGVFNVIGYGAVGDGATDDSLAIQRAYDAAYAYSAGGAPSMVLFPAGTYYVATPWTLNPIRTNDYWDSSTDAPVASATYLCRGIVTFKGYGATIKYTSSDTRFCWLESPNPIPAGTTYGNLVVEGFFVEHSDRHPGAVCGSVLWLTGQGNVDNVTVRDCSTDANLPRANSSDNVGGVVVTGGASTAQMGYFRDINVDDNVIHTPGQNVIVYDFNAVHSHVVDSVNVNGNVLDQMDCTGSNVMIGGGSRGWRCTATNNDCSNSNDDGIEIDAFNQTTITGNTFHRVRQFILLTRFALPYKVTVPLTDIANNTYSGACGPYQKYGGAAGGLRSPCIEMRANAPGGVYLMPPNWGDVVINDLVSSYTGSYAIHRPLVTLAGPMNSVTISDVNLTDPRGGTVVSIHPQSGGVSPLPVTIQGFTYNGKPLTMADVVAPGCQVTLLP